VSCLGSSSAVRLILKAVSVAALYVNLTAVLICREVSTEYLIFFYFSVQNIYLNGISIFISLHVISSLYKY